LTLKTIGPNGECKEDTNLKSLRRIIIKSMGKIPLKKNRPLSYILQPKIKKCRDEEKIQHTDIGFPYK
jgi:hypothetical protein